jgi:hypothetical protein
LETSLKPLAVGKPDSCPRFFFGKARMAESFYRRWPEVMGNGKNCFL